MNTISIDENDIIAEYDYELPSGEIIHVKQDEKYLLGCYHVYLAGTGYDKTNFSFYEYVIRLYTNIFITNLKIHKRIQEL